MRAETKLYRYEAVIITILPSGFKLPKNFHSMCNTVKLFRCVRARVEVGVVKLDFIQVAIFDLLC